MKIVVNRCFGGFSLSKEAYEFLGLEWDDYGYDYNDDDKRTDEKLIKCVEALGEKANGRFSRLEVVEIPDDIEWEISDYDGIETIHEKHRSW